MSSASRDPSNNDTTVYIAGHTGLVGSALVRRFTGRAGVRVLTATRAEVDLLDGPMVQRFLERARPDVVIIAAGKVGGILANVAVPAEFIYENLIIESSLIHGAWKAGVKRLLNFGSSCMYPKACPQPMTIDCLMTGPVEPTSEPYAVAKWAGMTLCSAYQRQYGANFITAIPCTVYGPGDSFDPDTSHVISALIRKLHEARTKGDHSVMLWGTGAAKREFLYADDLAEACEVLLERARGETPVNVGSGQTQTVRELAALIKELVGFTGQIHWDQQRPDGAPEKRLDSSLMNSFNWSARTPLRVGLERTYHWFLQHEAGEVRRQPSCVSS
ncbi:MAG: GDP-L-fucose synthase [Candidatus Omnitrophica bacterium]|nr:GDP-L-fucose synthase [Candidatus Omnitrophota bacterium]